MISNLIFGLLALFGAFYFYMKYKHGYWKRHGIPSVETHWLFGNIKDVIRQKEAMAYTLGKLHNQVREEDDVVGIYIMHKPFLLLRNPEIIKQVLIKDFHIFSNRYFASDIESDKLSSKNLFSINNPQWKYLRMKMSPVFSSGKVKKLFELMLETANNMKQYLDDQFINESGPKPILTRETCRRYTTDVIATVAFGVHVNSFKDPEPNFYTHSRQMSVVTWKRRLQLFTLFFLPKLGNLIRSNGPLGDQSEYFRNMFWDSITNREKSGQKRGDLIDYLVELKNDVQDESLKFEGDVLLAQSVIFFIAGLESSASNMAFTLCELAKNPEIQDRLRREIRETLKEQGMTYESVLGMKYLHQVISETLRLYPAAPILDRVASEDYKLPGTNFVVKKGMPVYVAIAGVHKDPRYYEDPEKYDPSRFEDQNKIESCTYLPFGDGPRNCIGLRVGMILTSVGLITILKDYEITLDPMCKAEPDPRTIFVAPPESLTLRFRKIKN